MKFKSELISHSFFFFSFFPKFTSAAGSSLRLAWISLVHWLSLNNCRDDEAWSKPYGLMVNQSILEDFLHTSLGLGWVNNTYQNFFFFFLNIYIHWTEPGRPELTRRLQEKTTADHRGWSAFAPLGRRLLWFLSSSGSDRGGAGLSFAASLWRGWWSRCRCLAPGATEGGKQSRSVCLFVWKGSERHVSLC